MVERLLSVQRVFTLKPTKEEVDGPQDGKHRHFYVQLRPGDKRQIGENLVMTVIDCDPALQTVEVAINQLSSAKSGQMALEKVRLIGNHLGFGQDGLIRCQRIPRVPPLGRAKLQMFFPEDIKVQSEDKSKAA